MVVEEEGACATSKAAFACKGSRGSGDDIKDCDVIGLDRAAVAARNCDSGGVCAAVTSARPFAPRLEAFLTEELLLRSASSFSIAVEVAPVGVAYLRIKSSTCCFRSFVSPLKGEFAPGSCPVAETAGMATPVALSLARMLNGDGVEAPGTIDRKSPVTEGTARSSAARASGETYGRLGRRLELRVAAATEEPTASEAPVAARAALPLVGILVIATPTTAGVCETASISLDLSCISDLENGVED